MKPFKKALKEAEKAEKLAKSAYKALDKKEDNEVGQAPVAQAAISEPTAPKKRGRQPGYSPKAAKAAAAPVKKETATKAKPGRKPTAAPAKAATSTGGDDLTQVKGVGDNIAVMLRANGVKTFADMAATSFDRYKELLKANGMSKFRDPSQWAARAAALANLPAPPKAAAKPAEPAAAPKKRGRQPGFSPKAAKGVINHEEQYKAPKTSQKAASAPSSGSGDDLTQVKGVGDNIAVMLKANGVRTFADMAATSFDRYKELLKANGMSKFRDPSQWAARAAALANLPAPPKAAAKPAEPAAAPKKRGRQPGFSPKAAKAAAAPAAPAKKETAPKAKPGKKPAAAPAKASVTPAKAATKSTGGDDLTQVKGVGDNIAVMLKANGVRTFADMAATSFDRYKELLKANGMSKFRDPSQWAARAAALANLPAPPKAEAKPAEPAAAPKKRGRQPGFSPKAAKAAATEPAAAPKKRGRQPGFSPKAAKAAAAPAIKEEAAPKAPAKPKGPPAKPDDLTQVKGVGQRVADALNKEGIYTYKDMAGTGLDRYKEILKDNNMSKFRDPSDWAKIAGELAGKK
ncbi:MAG: hypothetical protein IPM82_14445 [Saprospiraceae bacterium]|nr:hypothetical protein [Saprospiraceae bacterium]